MHQQQRLTFGVTYQKSASLSFSFESAILQFSFNNSLWNLHFNYGFFTTAFGCNVVLFAKLYPFFLSPIDELCLDNSSKRNSAEILSSMRFIATSIWLSSR